MKKKIFIFSAILYISNAVLKNDPMVPSDLVLEVSLSQLITNYVSLGKFTAPATCAAVVKANAYGLGMVPISQTLYENGCRHFFVATAQEGVELRAALAHADIYVLNGLMPEALSTFKEARLIPVLNDLKQLRLWAKKGSQGGKRPRAIFHFDTGIWRTGFTEADWCELRNNINLLSLIDWVAVMSHLSCSETLTHNYNITQYMIFERLRQEFFPKLPASFAASYGILLGKRYHYNMVRPGLFIYGPPQGLDLPASLSSLKLCATLKARIIKENLAPYRAVVGYDGATVLDTNRRLISIGAGYADGLISNTLPGKKGPGCISIQGLIAPIIGRVSMDIVVVDVTNIPHHLTQPGNWVEIWGPTICPGFLSTQGGSHMRALLARLSTRVKRIYKE